LSDVSVTDKKERDIKKSGKTIKSKTVRRQQRQNKTSYNKQKDGEKESELRRVCARIEGECGLGVVVPDAVGVEEAAETGDLGREMDDDDLHLDIELETQNLLAGVERLRARRDEHVALKTEHLERVDHLAKLGAPREHAELCRGRQRCGGKKEK